MQRINFTETTLTTLKRNARCSFANAVYKLTMKAQQGLKCDDLFKKSVLMNEVNKLLCKYKLDTCVSFHPYLEGGTSSWYFGIGSFTGTITYNLIIDGVETFIGSGSSVENIVIDINNNTEGTGVTAVLGEGGYFTIYSPAGCFIKADLTGSKDPEGAIPATQVTFLAGKCPQVETCVDYTEEELNCITPQDLQLLFEFTHKYKETLAKSTKRITSPSTSSSSPSPSDCCNWGSIGGSIGNQSDLITYLANIQKNYISIDNEGTEITNDVKSINFTGSGVNATYSGSGNVTVDIPGGGGGGGFECADLEGCNISLLTNDAGYLTDISATNGLTEDPANNFKLGGTLIEDTTITQDGYLMRFEGSAAAKLDFLVTIDKVGGLGSGLYINSDRLGAVINSAGAGLSITSVGSPIAASGNFASTLTHVNNLSNSQVGILNLYKSINIASAVNSGVFISMFPGTDSGNSNIQSSDISCLIVNATQPNVQSKLVLKPQGTSTGLYGSALEAYGSGKLQLPAYGQTPANFSGTPVWSLGVDASGNVVEFVGGGGGGLATADNGLTANTSTNVRLGGTLLANTTILNNGFDFVVSRSTTGGDAIKGVGTSGVGVRGQSTSQAGVVGSSSSNAGVSGVSTTGLALSGLVSSTTNNDIKPILRLINSNSSASDGIGAAIDFFAGTSSSSQVFAGQLEFWWSEVTNATRKSNFVVKTVQFL